MSKKLIASGTDYIPPLIRVVLILAGIAILCVVIPMYWGLADAARNVTEQQTGSYVLQTPQGMPYHQHYNYNVEKPGPGKAEFEKQKPALLLKIMLGALMILIPVGYHLYRIDHPIKFIEISPDEQEPNNPLE